MPPRAKLGDLGVDHLGAAAASDRDAMVAVDHEVRVAEEVDDDRREVPVRERSLNALPARGDLGPAREEVPVEVAHASFRPHDLGEGYRADADVALLEGPEARRRVLERQQLALR